MAKFFFVLCLMVKRDTLSEHLTRPHRWEWCLELCAFLKIEKTVSNLRPNEQEKISWPHFVRNYVISVHSLISLEIYQGLNLFFFFTYGAYFYFQKIKTLHVHLWRLPIHARTINFCW